MKIIIILIATSLVVALTFLVLFIRAVKAGQFDDTDAPARRMLFDSKSENQSDSS
ncbi:cbb3-type cytochrome oxidase assembly protein CcoS [Mangrovivirga cuniculi]|uniref:Cbb3-type cytochrome oxidase assembly protein CcoS n=1 Tax=Mangrovivirga cuniculi TaxID=2715131 RepID=A0A4D7JPH4_9BACT|nr:cbb3-type cytochrome oxidase assembly protein CcoS [Mangrovivirga cuniculi]QCK14702.1 cbb3-type cytochrome oxidase assembly protein CcoS [Mangrovivirga cuniculi]